jgi:hypothetical protein
MNISIIIAVILLILLTYKWYRNSKDINLLRTKLNIEIQKYELAKEENTLLALILMNLSSMVRRNLSTLDLNKLPFTLVDVTDDTKLTSIRFKEINDVVLVYINGAMLPYTGKIKYNLTNTFTPEVHQVLIEIINILHYKKTTGNSIITYLTTINNKLNN